jgi:hypothetical protein
LPINPQKFSKLDFEFQAFYSYLCALDFLAFRKNIKFLGDIRVQFIRYGLVFSLLWSGAATAGYRDMYRDKRYEFIDMRVAENSQSALACVLGNIYSAKAQDPKSEKREAFKKGGKSMTLVHWGKDVSNSLEVEENGADHTRIRFYGGRATGSFSLFEPCLAKGDGSQSITVAYEIDKDKSIAGRVIGNMPFGKVDELESPITRSQIVACVSGYPYTISGSYNASYYAVQIVGQENGSVKLGWYDSGNMVTGPKPLYQYLLITDFGEKRKIEVYLGRATDSVGLSNHWLAQLARACGTSGNNDEVTAWPRHQYWKPTQPKVVAAPAK